MSAHLSAGLKDSIGDRPYHSNRLKFSETMVNSLHAKIFAIFFENSEFGAVQRIANLVDLAKR